MNLTLDQLAKDITDIDVADIMSQWEWLLHDMKAVVTISVLGDMFLMGEDDAIYWLQTDRGCLSRIANDFEEYKAMLLHESNLDNWFLPFLVEKLIAAGKVLKHNEVYSYKQMPVMGGDYEVGNIEPCSMSVHFAFTGQICRQIQDLPDGTRVKVVFQKRT